MIQYFTVSACKLFTWVQLVIIIIIIIIICIQPLGQFGQRPELSQATGMALVRCILGKFLWVVCHCFPQPLDVPTFETRCLYVRHNATDPSGGRWNCGRECCPVILTKWRLPHHLGIFYRPQIYDLGPTASEGRRADDFFALKIRRLQPGLNPRTWVLKASTLPLDHLSRCNSQLKLNTTRE